jgi:hypothetical protein
MDGIVSVARQYVRQPDLARIGMKVAVWVGLSVHNALEFDSP